MNKEQAMAEGDTWNIAKFVFLEHSKMTIFTLAAITVAAITVAALT